MTFDDLSFQPHPFFPGEIARVTLKDGRWISVVRADLIGPGYEIMIDGDVVAKNRTPVQITELIK